MQVTRLLLGLLLMCLALPETDGNRSQSILPQSIGRPPHALGWFPTSCLKLFLPPLPLILHSPARVAASTLRARWQPR